MANSYTMTKRKPPNLRNKISRAVVIHGLVDARRACHIARDLGVEIQLVSSTDAVSYIGPTWFFNITLRVKQEFPDVVINTVLDCGDAAGGALAAWRAGIKSIHYAGNNNVAHKIEDIVSVARPAFEVWYKSLMKLWNDNKVPGPSIAQATMGDLNKAVEQGSVIVGSPDTVLAAIKDQIERLGVNYMTFAFYFGSIAHEDAMRSLHLFVDEIMPTF